MEDLENSPLLRVFNRKGKPRAAPRKIRENNKLSLKKNRSAQIQQPLKVLQPCSVDEQICSKINFSGNDICESEVAIDYLPEDQKKTHTPEAKSANASLRDNSDLVAIDIFTPHLHLDSPDFLSKDKLKPQPSEVKVVSREGSCCRKYSSSYDKSDRHSEADNEEQLVKSNLSSSTPKSAEFSLQSYHKSKVEKVLVMKSMEKTDCSVSTSVYNSLAKGSSENVHSHSPENQIITISSDSSDENVDDMCKYLKKLIVSGETISLGNIAASSSGVHKVPCETSQTPPKTVPTNPVLSSVKKLKELQSFLSSDDDYSPPPLNKRVGKDKKDDPRSLPLYTKKKNASPEHEKNVAPSFPRHTKDTAASVSESKEEDIVFSCDGKEGEDILSSSSESADVNDSSVSSYDDSEMSDQDYELNASSDSEDFEEFLLQVKTPVNAKSRKPTGRTIEQTKFINETDEKRKTATVPPKEPPKTKLHTGSVGSSPVLPSNRSNVHPEHRSIRGKDKVISSSSDDDDSFNNVFFPEMNGPIIPKTRPKNISIKKPSSKTSFLASLSSNVPESSADPEALIYRKQFTAKKDDLLKKLFALYNYKVFNEKLPVDMKITWNPRMTKTAGFCKYKRDRSVPLGRTARIELSPKVVDSADRVRDVLAHEMCHAASWLIHGCDDGHGSIWKYWACRVQKMFPEIPPVMRCHTYDINTKYVYKCSGCGGKIGRHSKSIDISKKICGRCGSQFQLFVNGKSSKTNSKPTGFALFVKENYGNVKKRDTGFKHADIMKVLSAEFSEKVKIST